MCGITATIKLRRDGTLPGSNGHSHNSSPSRQALHNQLAQSLASIAHRGPDAEGTWISDDGTIGLGHRRLAINDLTPDGVQPLHSDDGKIHAVVNGEIYDHDAIRERCIRDHGYQFKGHCDSEVFVALYKIYGAPGFFEHLRGEFSFVIFDERDGRVITARDRFGIKPMYWTIVGDGSQQQLLLTSEVKGFLPLGWEPEWNVSGLISGLSLQAEHTVYKDVWKLNPGSWMEIAESGEIKHHQYWDPEYKDKHEVESRQLDEIILEVRERIVEAVRLRLRADVPVGIYLSGGIDSSVVAGIVTKLVREEGVMLGNQDATKRISCFSIQFPENSGFNEAGEGADEHFAGYPFLMPDFLLEPDYAWPDSALAQNDQAREAMQKEMAGDLKDMFTRVGMFDHEWESTAPISRHLGIGNNALKWQPHADMFAPWVQDSYGRKDMRMSVAETMSAEVRKNMDEKWHTLHSSLYYYTRGALPNMILTCLGDRTEMAHSIEARPPFLDHHLVEYVNGLPPSLKIAYNQPEGDTDGTGSSLWWKNLSAARQALSEKWILKEAGKPFITQELYDRRKHPYSAPVKWPREGPIHRLFRKLITEDSVKNLGFLEWEDVKSWLEHGFGNDSDPNAFRKLVITGSWVVLSQRFGVKKATRGTEPSCT
ncbi:asparagine synthase [Colletotrichum simmondsii]|uniref:Asparagine synthase n=1 Tax=Colletotrichum simmondsii TaxID=703756 RepID=A0A135SWE7_9PEZI|nr:asparagine synthase [Colletotrichum simmondsii]